MEPTTTGRFRVLDRRPDGTILLVDLDAAAAAVDDPGTDSDADLQPIAVRPEPTEGADLADTIADLEPGYVVEASLHWDDSEARFADCAVVGRTRIQYADGVTGIFETARETWEDARAAGAAMNSAVTYSTGKRPNGVVYTFAKQRPPRDLFAEFRTGRTPIEPLIQRATADHAGDREGGAGDDTTADVNVDDDLAVFVMNPADEAFVLLYIVFEKAGLLARTVRDTYGLPAVSSAR